MTVVDSSVRAVSRSRGILAGRHEGSDATLKDRVLLVVVWAIVLGLIVGPIAYLLIGAFSVNASDPFSGLTLSAVEQAYAWPTLWLLIRSVGFSLLISMIAVAIATCWAWTTVRLKMSAAGVREALALAPLFVPPFVGTVAWIWLATPNNGLIDAEFRDLGFLRWLQPNVISTPGEAFVMVTQFVPFAYLFIAGAMRRLDSRLEEASLLCGRGITYTSFRITLRMLRASLLSAILFVTVLVMGMFAVPVLLDQSGAFAPLSVTVYNALFGATENFPLAAAVSTQLVIVCLVGLYLYGRALRRSERFVSVSGRGHLERQIDVSKPVATVIWAATTVYGLISFVIPFAALVIMAMSQFLAPSLSDLHLAWGTLWSALNQQDVWSALIRTTELSVGVPTAAVLLGTAIVYLSDRLHMRTSRTLAYVATAPLAVPGLVMGTGFLLLFIRTSLYGSLVLIGLGLVGFTVTHAVRIIGNGMHQLDRSLEEASEVCGVSRLRTLWAILVPLLRPSVFSSFVLVFALSSLDLTVPLPLYTPGTTVISITAWDDAQQAINQAAAIGLLQIAFLLAGLAILQIIFRAKRR